MIYFLLSAINYSNLIQGGKNGYSGETDQFKKQRKTVSTGICGHTRRIEDNRGSLGIRENSPSSAQLAKICKVFKLDYTRLIDSSDDVPYIDNGQSDTANTDENEKHTSSENAAGSYVLSRRKFIGIIICLGIIAVNAVAGLIATIVYAVKDAMYDAISTVWIISIPRNTPMIILCVFLFIFIVIIGAIIFYLFRRRKQ